MFACLLFFGSFSAALAQDLQPILQTHSDEIAKPSRSSVGLVLEDLAGSGSPQVTAFLEQWAEKNIWQGADGLFVIGTSKGDVLSWEDIDNRTIGQSDKSNYKQL
jgi:urea transport system permease protein